MRKKLMIFIVFLLCSNSFVAEAEILTLGNSYNSVYSFDGYDAKMAIVLTRYNEQPQYLDIQMYSNNGLVYEPDRMTQQNLKIIVNDEPNYFNFYYERSNTRLSPSVCHSKEEAGWVSSDFRFYGLKNNEITTVIGNSATNIKIEIPVVIYKAISTNTTKINLGSIVGRKVIKIELPENIVQEWKNVINS
ncbi:MAG: hypothetical protein H6Q70_4285 [Firmicutes bacterium]|nr:hypothetical protein [Bacillota bacterium]